MTPSPLDDMLGDWLAPPADGLVDRLFAARVDRAIDDLARLRAAENHYARGFLFEAAAIAAVLIPGLWLAQAPAFDHFGWLAIVPLAVLMAVLLRGGRQPWAGSSSAP